MTEIVALEQSSKENIQPSLKAYHTEKQNAEFHGSRLGAAKIDGIGMDIC